MTNKIEVPGNILGTTLNIQKIMFKTARPLFIFQGRFEDDSFDGFRIISIRFRAPEAPTGEWLGIATARTENAKIVAFHGGEDYVDCVKGLMNRLNNGSLKWKEDKYGD